MNTFPSSSTQRAVSDRLNNVADIDPHEAISICVAHLSWLLIHMARISGSEDVYAQGLECLVRDIGLRADAAWASEAARSKETRQ